MLDPRRNTPRHIIITFPKMKEERIFKAAREKDTVTYKGVTIRLLISLKKLCRLERTGKKYSKR